MSELKMPMLVMLENMFMEKFTLLAKKFTLPPVVPVLANLISLLCKTMFV